MDDPGVSRHEWEGEMAVLDDELHDDPAAALPELDELIHRMLEESGYDVDDAVARAGEERELVAEYLAAHELAELVERDSTDISPGDVAAAIDGLRAIFDYLVSTSAAADGDLADVLADADDEE